MKKVLLLIAAMAMMSSAKAINAVDEICGSWTTKGSYLYDSSFDGTFATNVEIGGTCVISKLNENTVNIYNLLGDDEVNMTGTVDLATNTISIEPVTIMKDGNDFTFAGEVGSASAPSDVPVTASINADGTITIKTFLLDYYGAAYSKDGQVTLSDFVPGSTEASVLWTRKGTAWDCNSEAIADVTMQALSDGTYKVTSFMGNEGYDLVFSVDANSQMVIKNAYGSAGGYDYVEAGSATDDAYYMALYTQSSYSAAYSDDWTHKVIVLDPNGGYIMAYAYVYNNEDKALWSGYYYVTWGPDYSITLAPARNAYNEKAQTQTRQKDMLGQDDFESELRVYGDGTYIMKAWQGVEGYDLKFQLAGNDSITVLNSDAEEVVTKKGNRYWRVPTGRADYDRACIYEDSPTYNTFAIAPERASITFGCSYLYPVGSNTGSKAYYCMKGYNYEACDTVGVSECNYDYEQGMYVDTVCVNKNQISQVVVYTLLDETTESTYYCIPDFLGEATGDLLFSIDAETGTATNIRIEGPQANGLYYYYIHASYQSGNENDYDTLVPGYYYTSYAKDDTEASLIIDMYYTPAGATDGIDTYYCLDMTGIAVDIASGVGSVKKAVKSTGIYDLQGRRLSTRPSKGMYIENGKLKAES